MKYDMRISIVIINIQFNYDIYIFEKHLIIEITFAEFSTYTSHLFFGIVNYREMRNKILHRSAQLGNTSVAEEAEYRCFIFPGAKG